MGQFDEENMVLTKEDLEILVLHHRITIWGKGLPTCSKCGLVPSREHKLWEWYKEHKND